MRVLLDTHVLAWWLKDAPQLSSQHRDLIKSLDNEVLVSAVSCWEIAIKVRAGKWPEAAGLVPGLTVALAAMSLTLLPISPSHAERAGLLAHAHKDPFDRLLAAQALEDGLTLATVDPVFRTIAGIAVV